MIAKKPGPHGKVRVTFSLPSSFWADTIHLVGDFNDWNTTATPLHLGDSCWSVTLDLEPGRSYQYRYLMNNTEWVTDWQADSFVHGKEGGSSVVITLLSHEAHGSEYTRTEPHTPPNLRIIHGGRSGEKQAV